MKKILITALGLTLTFFINSQNSKKPDPDCDPGVTVNSKFSRAVSLDSIIRNYAPRIIPGFSIAVNSESEGWWTGAYGYADLENKQPMQDCHLQYLQSVSKTFMAVEILQLKQQGKIVLDAPITKYLPVKYGRYIKHAEKITVRMLLNQTSGVPEYNSNPRFVTNVMMHPSKYFTQEDCLKSIAGEELQFAPGSRYLYTNTNYLLLSLIGDAITGDHAAFIRKNIFKPLAMNNSFYGLDHNYLDGLSLPQSYWDIMNISKPSNFTRLQQVTVASSKGDDGIVCTTTDAIKFLKGLMEGKLLKEEEMKEMLDFVKNEKGEKTYGMGIFHFDLGGLAAYGHGGGGVGAGCLLLYIPSHKMYLFISTNLGVLVDGKLTAKIDELRNMILMTLLQ
jgi:D-alanyl-D-alanine carboxypeptidase